MAGVTQSRIGEHASVTEPVAVEATAVLSSTALEEVVSAIAAGSSRDVLDSQLIELKRLVLGVQVITDDELDTGE